MVESSRRTSISSDDSNLSSPRLSTLDSSTALILVPDDEDSIRFDFTSEDEDDTDPFRDASPIYKTSKIIPPLSPSAIFLYLLSPYLKLGTMFLPDLDLPVKYAIPVLFFFAILSAFARQIWYLMARYLRKADIEDVILETFARGRAKERRREVLRLSIRCMTTAMRVMLATIYMRGKSSPQASKILSNTSKNV
jgi:hypothetical protein